MLQQTLPQADQPAYRHVAAPVTQEYPDGAVTTRMLLQDLQLDKDAIAAELADQMNRDLLSGRAAEDHPNVTKQQQGMSAAQADANMAALLREEAG